MNKHVDAACQAYDQAADDLLEVATNVFAASITRLADAAARATIDALSGKTPTIEQLEYLIETIGTGNIALHFLYGLVSVKDGLNTMRQEGA